MTDPLVYVNINTDKGRSAAWPSLVTRIHEKKQFMPGQAQNPWAIFAREERR